MLLRVGNLCRGIGSVDLDPAVEQRPRIRPLLSAPVADGVRTRYPTNLAILVVPRVEIGYQLGIL